MCPGAGKTDPQEIRQMPASPVRPRALGALVAATVLAGLVGTAAPAAAATETAAPVPTATGSDFAGPPAATESPAVVLVDGHAHAHPEPAASPRAVAAVPARKSAAAAKTPAVPTGLPTALEPLARYVAQADCDPGTKKGAILLGNLLTDTYPGTTFGGGRACTDHPPSEHYDGRAVDWMNSVRNTTQRAQANALLTWLFAKDARGNQHANARRLGVMYIIWNNKIWGSYSQRWEPYNNCAATTATSSDTVCHRDHMHFSLSWEGAMGRTSFWTKKVAAADYGPCRPADLNWAPNYTAPNPTACPRHPKATAPSGASAAAKRAYLFSGAQLSTKSTGAPVIALQNALGVTPADGRYGSATVAAVKSLQQTAGLRVNGIMNGATWRVLLTRYRVAAAAPKVSAKLRTFNTRTGVWTAAGGSQIAWGTGGDVPVLADYTGDGVSELAVYRPSTGRWLVRGRPVVSLGRPGDLPVPGRYASGPATSPAVYRPSDSTWHIDGSAPVAFGRPGDTPVPADYDGDGRTDLAVYTPATGTWTIRGKTPVRWGVESDIPVAADYNGDGRAEIAVYRPSSGQWRVQGAASVNWGTQSAGDVPVPHRYDNSRTADRAVWRPGTGEWRVRLGAGVTVKHKVAGPYEVSAIG
jgi:peptidoglycan hydrolase-like protein with peptidoglycan-binding domain